MMNTTKPARQTITVGTITLVREDHPAYFGIPGDRLIMVSEPGEVSEWVWEATDPERFAALNAHF